TSASIDLGIIEDQCYEFPDEYIALTLTSATITSVANAVVVSPDIYTATIINNDDKPKLSWSASALTVNENSVSFNVTATVDPASCLPVSFSITTGGTAGLYTDYTFSNLSVTIDANQSSLTIPVQLNTTDCYEGGETIVLTINNITNAGEGNTLTQTIYLVEDKPKVKWTNTSPVTISENEMGLTLTVETDSETCIPITIPYSIVSGTATHHSDYTILSYPEPFVITPGLRTASTYLEIYDDNCYEGDENLSLQLNTPTNATLENSGKLDITITENDALPSIKWTTIAQTVDEGCRSVTLSVELTPVSCLPVTITYT
ncbi:MAG: hypothetical protein OMM_14322, partial [Candidatus Magnetoglobus multicellularis str. Araruama]